MDGLDLVRPELTTAPRLAFSLGGAGTAVRVAGAALILGVAGCSAPGGSGAPFPGSAVSLDDLGRGVFQSFARNDREALEAFRLTEEEHNAVVWPELPAAQAEEPFPLDLAWRNIQLRNERAVPRAADALRRARAETFEGAECEGAVQSFRTFVVHTDCRVRFRAAGGTRYRVLLFKDALERNGGYKVFRYYDEDVERLRDGS